MSESIRYELVLVAQRDELPAIVRLQSLIKSAKRRFRFRLVSVKEVEKSRPKTSST